MKIARGLGLLVLAIGWNGPARDGPPLVHCRNGVDRTGYMLALYRVSEQGWDTDRALREMNRHLQFEWLNPVPQRVVRDGLRAP